MKELNSIKAHPYKTVVYVIRKNTIVKTRVMAVDVHFEFYDNYDTKIDVYYLVGNIPSYGEKRSWKRVHEKDVYLKIGDISKKFRQSAPDIKNKKYTRK